MVAYKAFLFMLCRLVGTCLNKCRFVFICLGCVYVYSRSSLFSKFKKLSSYVFSNIACLSFLKRFYVCVFICLHISVQTCARGYPWRTEEVSHSRELDLRHF